MSDTSSTPAPETPAGPKTTTIKYVRPGTGRMAAIIAFALLVVVLAHSLHKTTLFGNAVGGGLLLASYGLYGRFMNRGASVHWRFPRWWKHPLVKGFAKIVGLVLLVIVVNRMSQPAAPSVGKTGDDFFSMASVGLFFSRVGMHLVHIGFGAIQAFVLLWLCGFRLTDDVVYTKQVVVTDPAAARPTPPAVTRRTVTPPTSTTPPPPLPAGSDATHLLSLDAFLPDADDATSAVVDDRLVLDDVPPAPTH